MATLKKRCSSDGDSEAMSISNEASLDGGKKTAKRKKSNSSDSSNSSRTSIGSIDTTDTISSGSDMDQNVRVVARLRPLSTKEKNEQSEETIKALSVSSTILIDKNRNYEYDAVFEPGVSQSQVYEQTAGDTIKSNIFKGFNVTILAYGQTGSGKTFTMGTSGGNGKASGKTKMQPPGEGDGIIPRAVYDLFQTRQDLTQGQDRVKVKMSYLEIYNEEAHDLFSPDSSNTLHIRDSKSDGVYVQNLTWVNVKSPNEVNELMESASLKRATAATQMNAVSSRSHAICTLNVTITPIADMSNNAGEAPGGVEIRSKLTLVDLAGSERLKRTGAEGSRMKEGININKGLFVLGQVVSSLSELGQQQQGSQVTNNHTHVPYRDSKLTRLLQDSLGGNSRTILVACISPADSNVEESINTLRYAQRARNIKNSAVRNVVASAMSLTEAATLRRENQMLKLQVLQLESKQNSHASFPMLTDCNSKNTLVSSNFPGTAADSNIDGLGIDRLEIVAKLRAKCAFFQSKVEQLDDKSISAAEDALTASLKADRAELKLEQLLNTAKNQGINLPSDFMPCIENDTLIKKLRTEASELNSQLHEARTDAAVARATAAAVVASDGDLINAEEITLAGDDSYGQLDNNVSNQISQKMTEELIAVSGEIEQKEAMSRQINKERECHEVMKSHFEGVLQSLQEEVGALTLERQVLVEKVSLKVATSDREPPERVRKRITELETQIKQLNSRTAEHKKSLRMREVAEKKCAQLASEIQADKKRRAILQRKLKEDSEDRRSEKKAAQQQATRLLRDSQKLKIELQKVKDAAARQAAVLRRKAAESLSRQKKLAEKQRKRNVVVSMKSKASATNKGRTSDGFDNTHDDLSLWLEREIEASLTLLQTREQIEEQTTLLEEATSKQSELNNSEVTDNATARILTSEIDTRTGIIKQLEKNSFDFQKTFESNIGNTTDTQLFQDSSTWNSLSRSEVKRAFTKAFQRLVELKSEAERLKKRREEGITKAFQTAAATERKNAEETTIKLKVDHAEAMAALLESTKAVIEHAVQLNLPKEDGVVSHQSIVNDMLQTYFEGCTKARESLKGDLHDIKNQQNGMKQMMNFVAKRFLHPSEIAKATSKGKQKIATTKATEDEFFVFEEEDDLPFEDSDDSDWSPDTPARKKLKSDKAQRKNERTKSIESMDSAEGERRRGETILRVSGKDTEDAKALDKLKVATLREMLRERGLAVSGKKSELVARLIKITDFNSTDTKGSNGPPGMDSKVADSGVSKENHPPLPSGNKTVKIVQETSLTRKPLAPRAPGRDDSIRNREVSLSMKGTASSLAKVSTSTVEKTKTVGEVRPSAVPNTKLTMSARKRKRKVMTLAVSKAMLEVQKLKGTNETGVKRRTQMR